MVLQTNVMQYGGNGKVISVPNAAPAASAKPACACNGKGHQGQSAPTGEVDFSKMTSAEKMAYHKARWDRILG
jgi:hypothetical protein